MHFFELFISLYKKLLQKFDKLKDMFTIFHVCLSVSALRKNY